MRSFPSAYPVAAVVAVALAAAAPRAAHAGTGFRSFRQVDVGPGLLAVEGVFRVGTPQRPIPEAGMVGHIPVRIVVEVYDENGVLWIQDQVGVFVMGMDVGGVEQVYRGMYELPPGKYLVAMKSFSTYVPPRRPPGPYRPMSMGSWSREMVVR